MIAFYLICILTFAVFIPVIIKLLLGMFEMVLDVLTFFCSVTDWLYRCYARFKHRNEPYNAFSSK